MKTVPALFLGLCVALLAVSAHAASPEEIQALTDLYHSTNGPGWYYQSNWLKGDPCYSYWTGVTCTSGSVTSLVLTSNRLRGSIPESFGNLTNIETINLYNNEITGDLPESFFTLRQLTELNLSSNRFVGSIPSSFSQLRRLSDLNLSQNSFTGTVPSSFNNFTSLSSFKITNNLLSGAVPVEILNMLAGSFGLTFDVSNNLFTEFDWSKWEKNAFTSKTTINLYNNWISSNITDQIYWPYSINLQSNFFVGTLPDPSSSCPLTALNVQSNQLTGDIPPTIASCNNLQTISVDSNKEMAGLLPIQLANMPYLRTLTFYGTGLYCPTNNEVWDDFDDKAYTNCPYHYSYSSYNNDSWVWIVVGYVTAIFFVICIASVIIYVATRRRRVVILTNPQ